MYFITFHYFSSNIKKFVVECDNEGVSRLATCLNINSLEAVPHISTSNLLWWPPMYMIFFFSQILNFHTFSRVANTGGARSANIFLLSVRVPWQRMLSEIPNDFCCLSKFCWVFYFIFSQISNFHSFRKLRILVTLGQSIYFLDSN